MKGNYKSNQRLMASILLLSLFLQSCDNHFNQLTPIVVEEPTEVITDLHIGDEDLRTTTKQVDIKQLVDQDNQLSNRPSNKVSVKKQEIPIALDKDIDLTQNNLVRMYADTQFSQYFVQERVKGLYIYSPTHVIALTDSNKKAPVCCDWPVFTSHLQFEKYLDNVSFNLVQSNNKAYRLRTHVKGLGGGNSAVKAAGDEKAGNEKEVKEKGQKRYNKKATNQLFKILIKNQNNTFENGLHPTPYEDIDACLLAGADPNARCPFKNPTLEHKFRTQGKHALHVAIGSGYGHNIDALLDAGADPRSINGGTVLWGMIEDMQKCDKGDYWVTDACKPNLERLKKFHKCGADIHYVKDGYNLADRAIECNQCDVFGWLLSLKILPNKRFKQLETDGALFKMKIMYDRCQNQALSTPTSTSLTPSTSSCQIISSDNSRLPSTDIEPPSYELNKSFSLLMQEGRITHILYKLKRGDMPEEDDFERAFNLRNKEVVKLFIEFDVHSKCKNSEYSSNPLEWAIERSWIDILGLLIEKGAYSYYSRRTWYALSEALKNKYSLSKEMTELMIATGVLQYVTERYSLFLAQVIQVGWIDILKTSLEYGPWKGDSVHSEELTSLIFTAAREKKYETIPLLIKYGAKPDHPNILVRFSTFDPEMQLLLFDYLKGNEIFLAHVKMLSNKVVRSLQGNLYERLDSAKKIEELNTALQAMFLSSFILCKGCFTKDMGNQQESFIDSLKHKLNELLNSSYYFNQVGTLKMEEIKSELMESMSNLEKIYYAELVGKKQEQYEKEEVQKEREAQKEKEALLTNNLYAMYAQLQKSEEEKESIKRAAAASNIKAQQEVEWAQSRARQARSELYYAQTKHN